MANSTCIAKRIKESKDKRVGRDIRKGLVEQLVIDIRRNDDRDRYTRYAVDEDDWIPEGDQAWDGVAGRTLDPEGVKIARNEKIDEYHNHKVYEKVDEKECYDKTGKPPPFQ